MRALLVSSLLVSSSLFAGCALEGVDHGDTEEVSSEVAGALSAYGKDLVGAFQTTAAAADFDKIVLKSDGTYESSKTVYCIKAPCEPLKDSGRFIGYKPRTGATLGGLRLNSKSGTSTYYRVSLGAKNTSFKLSRDGKAWFTYDAVNKCDATGKRYVGHSKEQCMLIRFACDVSETYFSDDCGCGCQAVVAPSTCVVTGCSGQLCADADMMTTCEYRPEYACYASAICERDAAGKCGFRKTTELAACLSSSSGI